MSKVTRAEYGWIRRDAYNVKKFCYAIKIKTKHFRTANFVSKKSYKSPEGAMIAIVEAMDKINKGVDL